MGKQTAVRVIFATLAVLIVALVLIFTKLNAPHDILAKLQSQYQDFEATNSTFQGYESKKASVSTANGRIFLQVIEDVGNESIAKVISKLNSQIRQLGEKLTYFDPYKGETVEYSLPEELRPVSGELSHKGNILDYHIVYANEIFSYFVFSKEKASFRGVVSVFNCNNDVYKIEIFSRIDVFDENDSLATLRDLYCP